LGKNKQAKIKSRRFGPTTEVPVEMAAAWFLCSAGTVAGICGTADKRKQAAIERFFLQVCCRTLLRLFTSEQEGTGAPILILKEKDAHATPLSLSLLGFGPKMTQRNSFAEER
jgi:hypothetical protein